MKKESRRKFLLRSAAFTTVLLTSTSMIGALIKNSFGAPTKGKKKEAPLPVGQAEVTSADPVASAIGYNSDTTKVESKDNPTHKKGQNCSSCTLYTKSNESWGKCQMIQSGLVRAEGWCRSYNKKA